MRYLLLVIILVVISGAVLYVVLSGRTSQVKLTSSPNIQTLTPQIQTKGQSSSKPTENKLIIQDLKVGTGAEAKTGNIVSVNYIGTLLDGTKFDSSYDRGQPFLFTLGQRQVIQGWEQGILGMKVGGKRKLIIPPPLAYGAKGIPGFIPPNAFLAFEVEMLEVK